MQGRVSVRASSVRSRFPDLIKTVNLKVNRRFEDLLRVLSYRRVPISNPGAIIVGPFLEQLGIVEAVHTYGPETFRTDDKQLYA